MGTIGTMGTMDLYSRKKESKQEQIAEELGIIIRCVPIPQSQRKLKGKRQSRSGGL